MVSTDTLRRSATHLVPALASDVWQKWIRSSLTLLASAFAMVFVAMVGSATVLQMVRRWRPSSLSTTRAVSTGSNRVSPTNSSLLPGSIPGHLPFETRIETETRALPTPIQPSHRGFTDREFE